MNQITALCSELEKEFALHALVGLECEFYVLPAIDDEALASLSQELAKHASLFDRLVREEGEGQLEFSLGYTDDMAELVRQYVVVKELLTSQFSANFSSIVKSSQPASGLHVHIHLENERGERVFYKNEDKISDELKHSIAGLLKCLSEAAEKLLLTEQDKERIQSKAIDVPSTISWGVNNRSCAIRLPIKPHEEKHIEYRIAGANADASLVIEQVLRGVLYGLRKQPDLPEATYGNASDEQYNLQKLVTG